jgi:putative hydrolase of the HAD superfamily
LPKITTVFSDVGGVLLSNGWNRDERESVAEEFKLDWKEFETRHELVSAAFETGKLSLDQYLDQAIFHQPRTFSRQDVKEAIFGFSQPYSESLELMARLAQSKKYFLAVLSNESRELTRFRIERFGLRNYFDAFFFSCFLGVRKPDEAIYRLVLEITQRSPEECVFIDDRLLNLEPARRLGMRTIHFQDPKQLQTGLQELGIDARECLQT